MDHSRAVLRMIDNARHLRAEELARVRAAPKPRPPTARGALRDNVQQRLLLIAARWKETGDVRPAVRAVNDLVAEHSGSLGQGLEPWLRRFFAFSYDPSEGTFRHGRMKPRALDLVVMRKWPWWRTR